MNSYRRVWRGGGGGLTVVRIGLEGGSASSSVKIYLFRGGGG